MGEYGYGIDGVVTLPEFKELIDRSSGPLQYHGKPVRTVAYVYCVGSRQGDVPDGNAYCSRYCCAATVAASVQLASRDAQVHQYHLYRDMRTYGKFELMYTESRKLGSVYLKFADDAPPAVARDDSGRLVVTVRDLLTGGEELAIPADLVVLVTGMIPRKNEELIGVLKLPLGRDGFFNEIHPKLRPVETVVDGVYIAGACQGPKNSSESVASGLAAVTQSAVILKKGFAELDPLVATVDADRLHRVRAVRRGLPVRGDRDDDPRRHGDRRSSARPAARAAAVASRSARRTRSTCAATPTPRSPR